MIGQKVSHYEIVQKLGAGGMGDIYKANDTRLNRSVAIKVLAPTSSAGTGRRRFLQEAQAASALNHPNIITIHDIVSQDDNEFMVLEFVAGKTLADLIPAAGLGVPDTLRYGVQIADALQAAHAVGIIHRDLKPGNVMVTDSGLVKVLDFGLAKFTSRDATADLNDVTVTHLDAPLTVQGSIIGTVSYMSPEQAQGNTVDHRSDIFSFGVLLYEMVTGRRAFQSDSAISTITAILRDDVAPITGLVKDVPPGLEQIIARAVRKLPGERWQSMQEVQQALIDLKRQFDSGALTMSHGMAPVAATPPPPRKKSHIPVIAAAAGFAVLSAAGGWMWKGIKKAAAPPVQSAVVAPAPPVATPADSVLTNQSVLDMLDARMSPSLIISQIRASKTNFNLSTPEVIRLAKAGVPESVIEVMRNPAQPTSAGTPRAPSTPAAASPAPPEAAPAQPPPAAPEPTVPTTHPVAVADGLPFMIRLMEDVPANPAPGQTLRFEATKEFRIGNSVVIAPGAAATGTITEAGKKKFLGNQKPTYRLLQVTAVDGSKLNIRATPAHRDDAKVDRTFEVPGRSASKELSAAAGTEYIAYIEGVQAVSVRQ